MVDHVRERPCPRGSLLVSATLCAERTAVLRFSVISALPVEYGVCACFGAGSRWSTRRDRAVAVMGQPCRRRDV